MKTQAQRVLESIGEAGSPVTFAKMNTADAKKTDNHRVMVDGIQVGVIGWETVHKDTKIVFISDDVKALDGKQFDSIATAKKFLKKELEDMDA